MGGMVAEALSHYGKALEVNARYAPAHYNIGVVHTESGNHEEAISCYKRALECNPQYVEAYCNLGVVYKSLGRLEEAIAAYRSSLKVDPMFVTGRSNLAIALTDLGTLVKGGGRLDDSVALYEEALCFNFQYADAHYNLGVALAEQGHVHRAIVAYQLAAHFNPLCAEALNNMGVLHKESGGIALALSCYVAALKVNPRFAQAHNNAGVVYTLQGRFAEALHHLKSAVELQPGYAEAYNNLGVLHRDEGEIPAAILRYEQCLRLDPANRNAGQNRLLALNYINRYDVEEVIAAHSEWGKRFSAALRDTRAEFLRRARHTRENAARRRISGASAPLRVGMLSPDLFTHSVSYFVEAIARHHDRRRVTLVALSAVVDEDARTCMLRGLFDEWVPCAKHSALELALLADSLALDVLIELSGHTAANRLDAMALHPAPMTVTYCGYPNTTGLQEIDVRLGDAHADPPGSPQRYVERLVRLPRCFLCYTPPAETPEVAPAPCLANGYVTLGTFNNLAKVTAQVMQVWADILLRAPTARLLVKSKLFASAEIRQRFVERMSKLGVEPERVTAMELLPHNFEHLDAYKFLDLALDCFPYTGTTTSCESLFMGVPTLTWSDDRTPHAQNVTTSMLRQLPPRLQELLICRSSKEYAARAVELTKNPQLLAELRENMRKMLLHSPLCDGPGFTRNFETTLLELFESHSN